MILKTVTCDICGEDYQELRSGDGFPGWGQLQGIALDGIDNPYFCPTHLAVVANFVSNLRDKEHGLDS